MVKKQNKNLWLWIAGIVIVGIFIGPKLGLFSMVSNEPETLEGYSLELMDSLSIECGSELIEDFKHIVMSCDPFLITDLVDDSCLNLIQEQDVVESSLYNGVKITTINTPSNTNIYLLCSEDDKFSVMSNTKEDLYGYINTFYEEDTNGGACADDVKMCHDGTYVSRNLSNNCEFYPCIGDKWYNDCLFNYGEEDKCFSILYGIFALAGILLLMMFMRK